MVPLCLPFFIAQKIPTTNRASTTIAPTTIPIIAPVASPDFDEPVLVLFLLLLLVSVGLEFFVPVPCEVSVASPDEVPTDEDTVGTDVEVPTEILVLTESVGFEVGGTVAYFNQVLSTKVRHEGKA